LGLGNNFDYYFPQQIPGLFDIVDISAHIQNCFAFNRNGTAYAWGQNGYSALGLGDSSNKNTPQIIGISNITKVSAGYYSALIQKYFFFF
jgi:alpha-tubulin suppressor-like RCC1 family protein